MINCHLQYLLVHTGDRVIEVNSVSLMKVTHRQAVETLRSAPAICKLVLEKSSPLMGRHSQQNLTASSVGSPTSLAESPNSFSDANTTQLQDGEYLNVIQEYFVSLTPIVSGKMTHSDQCC